MDKQVDWMSCVEMWRGLKREREMLVIRLLSVSKTRIRDDLSPTSDISTPIEVSHQIFRMIMQTSTNARG